MNACPSTAPLARLLAEHGDEIPLDLGAAAVAAAEQPGLDPREVLAALDEVAAGLRIPKGASVFEAVARLNHHLFLERGFHGDRDEYDAPENSFLDRVIERRRGLPILLSILYVEVGRRAGFALHGVGFPGHFVAAPTHARPPFFVDPFHGGRIQRPEALLARLAEMTGDPLPKGTTWHPVLDPVHGRQVLIRVFHNLKAAYLRRGQLEDALRAVDRLVLLDPEAESPRRARAALLQRLGRG